MEIAITKMSQNGQVVIPSEIRKEAGIEPATKFLVFNSNGNILLKRINSKALEQELHLLEKILKSEKEITEGKYMELDSSMSFEEMDALLRGRKRSAKKKQSKK